MRKTKRINNFSELDLVSIVRAFKGITHDVYWGGSSSQILREGCEMHPDSIYAPHSVEHCLLPFQAFFWRNHRIIMFTKAIRMMMIPGERTQKRFKVIVYCFVRPNPLAASPVAHVKRDENWFTRPDLPFEKDDYYFLESLRSARPPAKKCMFTCKVVSPGKSNRPLAPATGDTICVRSKLTSLNNHILVPRDPFLLVPRLEKRLCSSN